MGMTRRFKRRTLSILVILMMTMAMVPTMVLASSPADIASHWAQAQIEDFMAKGLVNGYPDGTFKPDNNITRAEFMVLVNGAFGYSEKVSIDYKDVTAGAWYADAVSKARAAGYIAGYNDGSIKPDHPISRQEAAVIIMQVKKLGSNETAADQFTDAGSIPGWSKGGIGAVVAAGIMGGYPDGTFKGRNSIKRSEAVTALSKALGSTATASVIPTTPVEGSKIYDKAGTYGPVTGTETIKGNVTIKAKDVILQNTIIEGKLIIDKDVADGNATLKKVVVQGDTYIYGGGTNSVYFIDTQTGKVYLMKDDGPVRIVASGTTEISQLIAQSSVRVQEVDLTGQGFEGIVVDKKTDGKIEINLVNAKVEDIQVKSEGVTINADKDTRIAALVADAQVAVTGTGTVAQAEINASGVSFETRPASQTVAPGISAPTISTSNSSSGSSGGGGGGGSSSSPVAVSAITVTSANNASTVVIGGTLQMSAAVIPANATNQTITWSVAALAAGTATIDTSGLLTATGLGSVTVTATNAASGVTGTKVITITQPLPVPKVDVGVQNGTIYAAADGQSATYVVTTSSICDGQTLTITKCASDGTAIASGPTSVGAGISVSGSNVSSSTSTITVAASHATAGTYYFKVTIAGVTSDLVTLVVTPAITDVTSSVFTTSAVNNAVIITLTGGTYKAGAITAGDFTFAGTNAAALAAGTFTRTSDTVVTITNLTLAAGTDNTVLVKAAAQVTQASSVTAAASIVTTDVTSPAFTTAAVNNIVTITLTGGTFKAGVMTAGDFTFAGTNAAALAAGTFTRTSDTAVTITNLTLAASSDNTVLVKAATQATRVTSLTAAVGTQLTITNPTLTLSKTYDGNTTAAVTAGSLIGAAGTDVVTVSATATYDTKTAGTNKTITVVYTLNGADAAKYIKPIDYVVNTGAITPKKITSFQYALITATKTYDGNTNVSFSLTIPSSELVAGDAVTAAVSGNYSSAAVGTKKFVATPVLSGADAGNYTMSSTSLDGKIKALQLTVSDPSITLSKTHDGTTTAAVTAGSLIGVIGTDDVTVSATATYDTADVGTNKTVTVVYTLSGTAAGNYIKPVDKVYNTGSIN